MNLRRLAFAAIVLIALGAGNVSLAQTGPGPQGTPPPPPVPAATSSTFLSTSPQPTALPSNAAPPTSPAMTPTPEPFSSPSTAPAEAPTPGGRRGRHAAEPGPSPSASPTETPEPPQFSTLDGVWEIALQPLNGARTVYSHLYVTQSGNALTGTWKRDAKTSLPFTGTFDGRLFKISVPDGSTTIELSGYEENYMDMVGLISDGDPKHQGTPFTAAHRKRDRDRSVNIR